MNLTEEKSGKVAVLRVEGRIDALTSPQLEATLLGIIQRGERSIVIDLAEVDYISSAGLRVLLIGAKQMRVSEGSICLASLQIGVKDVLASTGFMNLFRIFKSGQSALEELA
jgi:anti-sigma B factor antagonist